MAKNVSSVDLLAPSTASAWADGTTYSIADIAQSGGTNYFCTVGHVASGASGVIPTNTGYWTALPYQAIASGAAAKHYVCGSDLSFQAVGACYGAGTGTASVQIQVSNAANPTTALDWYTLDTLNLVISGATIPDIGYTNVPWRWVRANAAITGSGATVSCFMAALT